MNERREHPDAAPEPVLASERPIGRRRGDRIVGAGRLVQELVEQARLAARSDRPVWISGPPGSGKRHFARAVHAWSSRASAPLVLLSCPALPDGAAARELFGGSDPGDPKHAGDAAGALGRAASGTLLLVGADRLPAAVRERLARALESGSFRREGDGGGSPLSARLIATSVAPPERPPFGAAPVHELRLPPLSERREDVLPLAAHFLRLAADEEGHRAIGFTSDARNALLAEPWPGNVGELCERIRQAVRLAGDGAISAEALLLADDADHVPSFKEAKRAFETRYVVGLLRRCGGNISRAARLAKKDRKDFYDVIRRTGVNPSDYR